MYIYETTIKLHQTDAAGVLFFANYFKIAHDAYESFLESISHPFAEIFAQNDYLLLIVHAEADYMRPLTVGEAVSVEIRVAKMGRTSYSLDYSIKKGTGQPVANVKTVHAAVDGKTHRPIRLPESLRSALERHQ